MAGTPVTGTFTATGVSLHAQNASDGEFAYAITGTFVGKVYLERSVTPSRLAWEKVAGPFTAPCSMTFHSQDEDVFRLNCTSHTSGTISYTITPAVPVPASAPYAPSAVAITGGSINITASTGLQISGNTALVMCGSPGANTTLAIGSNAGAAQSTSTGGFNTFVGDSAGQYTHPGSGENTFVGNLAGVLNTTGVQTSYFGCGAGWVDGSSYNAAFGSDTYRSVVSANGANSAFGQNAMRCGGGTRNSAVGMSAMQGTSTTITFSGTQTASDVVTLTFTIAAPGVANGYAAISQPVTVPVTAGMTSAQLAAAASNAINAVIPAAILNHGVQTGTQAVAVNNSVVMTFPGTSTTGACCGVTYSVSGAATEVITVTTGFLGTDNVAVGFQALQAPNATTATSNIAVGSSALASLTTGSVNIAIGQQAGQNLTTSNWNVLIGQVAGQSATTAAQMVAIGNSALTLNVTASNDTAVGSFAMSAYVGQGTGQGNVSVGCFALSGASGSTTFGSVAVGHNAGKLVSTAGNLTAIGYAAGSKVTTGSANTLIGSAVASTTLATGSGNIYVGVSSAIDAATAAESNTFRLGNHATNTIRVTGINTATPAFFLDWFPASTSYASDSAAATGGVAIGQIYRNGSVMQVRIS